MFCSPHILIPDSSLHLSSTSPYSDSDSSTRDPYFQYTPLSANLPFFPSSDTNFAYPDYAAYDVVSSNVDLDTAPQHDVLAQRPDQSHTQLPSKRALFPSAPRSHHLTSHPYQRSSSSSSSSSQQQQEPKKRGPRRIWNHALEKFIFTPHELATLGAPNRRTIYLASLEAHIDRLHSQLLGLGLYPIPFEALSPYKGLNCKTAKGMVAGLQFDIATASLNLLELERAANRIFTEYASQESKTIADQSERELFDEFRYI